MIQEARAERKKELFIQVTSHIAVRVAAEAFMRIKGSEENIGSLKCIYECLEYLFIELVMRRYINGEICDQFVEVDSLDGHHLKGSFKRELCTSCSLIECRSNTTL